VLFGLLHEIPDAVGAVEEGILGMRVEMDEAQWTAALRSEFDRRSVGKTTT
jgi:hypothetical protein